MKRKLILTYFSLLLCLGLSYAQPVGCGPNGPNFPAAPGTSCDNATFFCDGELDGFCSTLPNGGADGPNPLCPSAGVPNNIHWITFVAGTANITLQVTPSNCEAAAQQGVQAGVYEECDFLNAVACQGICQTNPFSLVMNNLIIGNVYFLLIDGCAGNICDYSIAVTQGSTTAPAPQGPFGPISPNPLTVCEGLSDVLVTMPPVANASNYFWSVPPGATYTENNALGNEILVTFGTQGGQICVEVNNDCHDQPVGLTCTDVNMLPTPTSTLNDTYCTGSSYEYNGNSYTGPGPHTVTLTGASYLGCDSIVNIFLTEYQLPTTDDYGTYCENDGSYNYPGDGGNYPEGDYMITFFGASYEGCDSTVELHVTQLYNSQDFQEVALCQLESHTVCGIPYDVSGSYQIDCNPNYAGCDSLIYLDLYVLEPMAVIAPPATIGCGANSSIYLDGFSSFGDSFEWTTTNGTICDNTMDNLFFEVCMAGTYCLTATSTHFYSNGGQYSCTNQMCVDVISNSEPPATTVASSNVDCPGDTNGSATITVSNPGVGPFTYDWNPNVSITNTASGLAEGTYTVTITADQNGCTTVESIVIGAPTPISISTTQQDIACNGGTTGTATATPSGGTAPFTYSWCNGDVTATATGLGTGDCQVVVTDANNCTSSATVTIIEASAITASISPTNVACNGESTGSATVTPNGGTPPYTYLWCNGNMTATATGLPAGTCTVVITDSEGCTLSQDAILVEPGPISLTTDQTDVSCDGDTNGTATVTPSGGIGPFSYLWCNNDATATATGLGTGDCQVVVTDGNGCTATATVTITAPNALSVSATQTDVSCNGGTDGTATATPSGGTGPFTYLWCNSDVSPTATSLGAGPCTVVITDANGCTATTSVTLTEPSALSLSTTQVDIACNGDLNGEATVTPTGGTAPYSYAWCNGNNTNTATGLGAGTCTVIVTDVNGCTSQASVDILEASELTATANSTDVLCNGESSGTGTANPTGGTAPYTYLWCNGDVTQTTTSLAAGTCQVVITDANGCSETLSVSIAEPNAMAVSVSGTDVSCATSLDGEATASASGGVGPYTFVWCDSQNGPDATGLAAGTCSVVVTDANGCSVTESVQINAPSALALSVTSEDVTCFGAANGTATVTPSGGTAPYGYDWCNGQGTATATGLDAGTCDVVVTDANGCTETISVTLTEPASALSITGTSEDAACGADDGSISVSVSGGTTPYTYDWDNAPDGPNPTDLAPGNYTLTVTDDNDCTATFSIEVNTPSGLSATSAAVPVSCNAGSDGEVSISVTGGTTPYTYDWDSGLITPNTTGGTDLPANTYSVTVTDDDGCTYVTSATVTEPPVILLDGNATDETCGESNGTISLSVQGGTEPYSFDWDLAPDVQNPTDLPAGNYSVVVTDANGCTETYSTTVSTPNALALSTTQLDVSCNGGNDGSIDLEVSGGIAPFDFDWGSSGGNEDLNDLTAGDYTVIVTDDTGCSVTTSVTILEPVALSMTSTIEEATCGDANGSISIVVSGGTAPYSYDWDNGAGDTDNPTGLEPIDHTVVITDANGCELTQTVEVTTPPAIQLSISGTMTSCFAATDGTADLEVTGGTAPFTYDWSSGSIIQDPQDLPAGDWNVLVTDNNGCTETTSITIGQPDEMVVDGSATNATCGEANGSIAVATVGGTAPYTYAWSGGIVTTGPNPTDLAPGSYTTVVTDDNGCTAEFTIAVDTPDGLSLNTEATDVPCNGESVGTIDLTVSGGVEPFTYEWDYNNEVTEDLADLPAGTYEVIVTDATGCTIVASATVNEPAVIDINSTILEATCGDANGGISLTVTGGTTPYSYDWDNADDVQNPTGLATGDYNVIVTDANGCTATYGTTVTTPAELLAAATQIDVSCNGGADGSADLTVSGGTAPFTYQWSNGSTDEDPTGLSAGPITGTVIDANGCEAEVQLTLTEPTAIAIDGTITEAFCGEANGSIDLTVSGGTAPYSYDWDNAPDVEDPQDIVAGTYNVVVTDLNGCTAEYTVAVTTPNALALSAAPADAACNSENSGSIDLTVTGGVAPFDYQWDDANNWTGEDLVDVPVGTYTVIVTDATDCTVTLTEVINEPTAIQVTGSSTDALCGQDNGTISTVTTGGTAPYTYLWSNGSTDPNPTGLGIGNFVLTVTDANSCTVEFTQTVDTPNGLALDETATATSCNGGADGTAGVTVSGGTAPFTYLWDNGMTTPTITDLSAGTYTVVVTDADGCTVQSSSVVSEPAAISIAGNTLQETCGNLDGSITIVVDGGTTPYSYDWDNAPDVQNPTGLATGDYNVIITDANGCTATEIFNVGTPAELTGGLSATSVSCNGGTDGSLAAFIFGGEGDYSYDWSTGNPDGPIADNLSAGTVTLIVTDGNGCTLELQEVITEPTAIMIDGTSVDALCGEANGSIATTVTGGTAPYSYDWDLADDVPNPNSLDAGAYNLTVTDGNNCTATYSINVNTPTMLLIDSAIPTDASCNGGADGTVDVTVSGGTAPYTYDWDNALDVEDPQDLPAGDYILVVTDNDGCTTTTSVSIGQPDPIVVTSSSSTQATCNENNGTISIDVTGGTSPYTYAWSNSDTNEDPQGLGAGNYIVTITDLNGCTIIHEETVSQPDEVSLATTEADASCNGAADGSIDLILTGGVPPFSFDWDNAPDVEDPTGLSAGTYTVVVTDGNGCTFTASAIIAEPEVLLASVLVPTSISCNGGNDGSITLTVTGGTAPYSYDWDSAPDVQNPTGLSAGTYTVVVTDANGCTATTSETLSEPSAIVLSTQPSATLCSNSADGSIDLNVNGGTAPYTYAWSNATTDEDPAGLTAGAYVVVVTDANGCTATISEEVTAPEAVLLSIASVSEYSGFNVSCSNSADGSATAQAIGGVPPFTYQWSGGVASGATVNELSAGTYTVIATDANGCSAETQVSLEAPESVFVSTFLQDVSCYGDNDGAIIVDSIAGGSSPYMYSLNGGDFSQFGLFSNLTAGDYDLVVQDANGCELLAQETIIEPGPVQVEIFPIGPEVDDLTNSMQLGDSVQLEVIINRDTATLQQYGWTQGLFWNDPGCDSCQIRWVYPMETTNYEYLVVDENGCIGQAEYLLNVRKERAVYIPNAFSPNADGINDMFFINAGQEVDRIEVFKIFNRWGEVVFELNNFFANDPNSGWDGRFKGELMNRGVFIYYVEVLFIDGRREMIKGDVTIMK